MKSKRKNFMKIDVENLRTISNLLFDHLKKNGFKNISINEDFYWNIPKEKRYDAYEKPADLKLCQLSHDYENLLSFLNDKNKAAGYGFVQLGEIFKIIGEKVY